MNSVRDRKSNMFGSRLNRSVSNGAKILRYCFILLIMSVLLTGSAEGRGKKKPPEKIKIQDILPKGPLGSREGVAVGLYIYVFELDSSKYLSVRMGLNDVNDLPVEYKDFDGFAGNGLVSGGGDINTWRNFAKVLSDANARVVKRISVYINPDANEEVAIADLKEPAYISYRIGDDISTGVGLPAGTIALRIAAKPLIGLKQVCRLDIVPVFMTKITDKKPKNRKNPNWEYVFDSTAVSTPIRPGQFICIAPDTDNFPRHGLPVTGKLIFCSDNTKSVVRLCLIACGLIND
jgi:hypothetical protein